MREWRAHRKLHCSLSVAGATTTIAPFAVRITIASGSLAATAACHATATASWLAGLTNATRRAVTATRMISELEVRGYEGVASPPQAPLQPLRRWSHYHHRPLRRSHHHCFRLPGCHRCLSRHRHRFLACRAHQRYQACRHRYQACRRRRHLHFLKQRYLSFLLFLCHPHDHLRYHHHLLLERRCRHHLQWCHLSPPPHHLCLFHCHFYPILR